MDKSEDEDNLKPYYSKQFVDELASKSESEGFRAGLQLGTTAMLGLILILSSAFRLSQGQDPSKISTEQALVVLDKIKENRGVAQIKFTDEDIKCLQQELQSNSLASIQLRRMMTKLLSESENTIER